MTLTRASTVLVASMLLFAGLCGVASAQSSVSIPFSTGNAASFDGLNVLVSSCTYGITTPSGSSGPACSTLNDNVVLSLSGSALSVQLTGASGAPVMSAAGAGAGTSNYYDDITFNLAITPAVTGSKTTVSSLSAAIAGSGCSTCLLPHVTAGITVTPGTSAPLTTLNISADGQSPVYTGTKSFGAVSSLSINGDLKINLANTANTLVLTSVSQILAPAPEPESILLVATGIGGLIAGRRGFRQRRKMRSQGQQ